MAGVKDPFESFGLLIHRVRYGVVPAWILITLAMAGLFAPKVGEVLKGGGFSTPDSSSQRADAALGKYFHSAAGSTAIVVFRSSTDTVDSDTYKSQVTSAESDIKQMSPIHSVVSYYDSHDISIVSSDKHTTYMIVSIDGDDNTVTQTVPKLRDKLKSVALDHYVSGGSAAAYDGAQSAQADVESAEKLTFPVVIVLLILSFGTLGSALLPLLLGLFTVILTVSLVGAIGMKIDTAIFALNVGSMLGLGLAIDYSLIVITRFREEYALWKDSRRALGITLATSGRSITYSGLTVILAMLVMTIALWPMMLIRTMSMSVMLCAIVAVLLAMTLLPAVLSMLGHRVEWVRIVPRPKARKIGETGIWYAFSQLVMRQPAVWLVGALLVLVLLAAPVSQLTVAGPAIPGTTEAAKGDKVLNAAFGGNKLTPIQIVIETSKDGVWTPSFLEGVRQLTSDLKADDRVGEVDSLASAFSTLPPDQFDSLTPARLGPAAPAAAAYVNTNGDNNVMTLNVVTKYDSHDARTEALVKAIRSDILPKESAFKSNTIYVGGEAATIYDYKAALLARFPYGVAVVMLIIFVMLAMFFQSIFLPVKAVVLNLLSISATFGVLVLVFQHGFAAPLIKLDPLGYITIISPVLLYVILFALSTDYEVFMLSRVKEYYYSHGDNKEAVAVGLQHTAGVITAAALILLGTFGSFSFGGNVVVKELGVGLAVGVLIDSTLVRIILVPASMALMGSWNWYMPGWLKRFVPELSEGTSMALAGQAEAAAAPVMAAAPAASTRPPATGPAVLRLRSKTLPVVDAIKVAPGQPIRFGRDDGNEIQIVVPQLSRVHARIDNRDGIWRLRDLGSTNGTWVDGERVPPGGEGVTLHNGDWIMLGGLDDFLAIFEAQSAPQVVPQATAVST